MDCQKIGNFILEVRKEKNMTQKQLADKLHITDRAVSKWERGLGVPDVSLLADLSDVLGVSINEILAGEKIDKLSRKEVDRTIIDGIRFYSKSKSIKYLLLLCIMSLFLLLSCFIFNFIILISNTAIYYFFIMLILLFITLVIFLKLDSKRDFNRKIVILFCILYSITVFIYTFFTGFSYLINGMNDYNLSVNLVPIKPIFDYFGLVLHGAQNFSFLFDYLIVDLCLFMPYSLFIPYLKEKEFSVKKFFSIMLVIILLKEFIQLVTGFGIFDINDILLNFLGLVIMYYILKIINMFKN